MAAGLLLTHESSPSSVWEKSSTHLPTQPQQCSSIQTIADITEEGCRESYVSNERNFQPAFPRICEAFAAHKCADKLLAD